MSDMSIQLSGDDQMAVSFLTRAANAIVERSELSTKVAAQDRRILSLEEESGYLNSRRETLEARNAALAEELTQARARIAQLQAETDERARRIEALESEVASLENSLGETLRERDEAREQYSNETRDHLATLDDLTSAQRKLATIQSALGVPAPEVAAPQTFPDEATSDTAPPVDNASPSEPPPQDNPQPALPDSVEPDVRPASSPYVEPWEPRF